MDDTIIKTQRLVLRYQRKSDIKFLVDFWMDEEHTKFTGGPRDKMFLIDEFREVAENPRGLEYDLWPLELKNSHELVGQAGFIPKTIKDNEYVELNYYIDKSKWGKGFAKEIAKALIEYGFTVKKLDKIIAIIDPENEASKAVAKASGMKYWINETRSGKIKSVYCIKNESK
ncbi:MAG: GNAT family protein [Spirochaetia bacterium]|nr:GNAT family protein [Spirochaetia bacterium]